MKFEQPPNQDNQGIIALDDLEEYAKKEKSLLLFHGGLDPDAGMIDIDLDKNGEQQNKKGRTYGGFYLCDNHSKAWAEDYAKKREGNLHAFLIDKNCRIFVSEKENIDRLSREERVELAKDYDLIKGRDLLKRTQYILLNKNVVKKIGFKKIRSDEK